MPAPLHPAPLPSVLLIKSMFISALCGRVQAPGVGGSRNRAALLPTLLSPFFCCTKEQIQGGTGPPSAQGEMNLCLLPSAAASSPLIITQGTTLGTGAVTRAAMTFS